MEQNAFMGGVEPGGLWNKNDIRILLCFILLNAGGPLSGEDLSAITQSKGLANYFEVGDALSALKKQGNVEEDRQGRYSVTASGREIAQSLNDTLPLSVRDKAMEAALRLSAEIKVRRETQVNIRETDKGFLVECHISDGQMDLMTLSLYAPDRAQAALLEKNFYRGPQNLYRLVLAQLTGDKAFLQTLFED